MSKQRLSVLILLLLQLVYLHEISGESYFSQLSDSCTCTCPLSVTYECTVTGGPGAVTIWEGSALNKFCTDSEGEILLLHNRYELYMTQPITCGNSTIVGRSVRVENNSYTSHLTITVSPNIIPGDNIVCARAHNNNGTNDIIGNATISLQAVLSANEVYVSHIDIDSRQLGFTWSPVAPDCAPDVHYNILASNCGRCPTTTNHTTVTCTDVPTNGSMCMFTVQTVVYGHISGNASYSFTINSTTDRGNLPNKVSALSLPILLVGVVCLVASVIMIVCCLLYLMKKSNDTKSKSRSKINNHNHTISFQNNETVTEIMNRDTDEYGHLEQTPLNLKSLLQKLQGQISKQWYQFGLALGLPMDILEGFNLYSEEDYLVEVLDYWLKHHPTQPTWQDITDAQSKIESFNTHQDTAANKKDTDDIPPPKPPRRSSSVTARNSITKRNSGHDYEYVP